ncbi:MAG: hypothetical protein ACI855_001383, partial [Myxococcota bacterium]
MNNNDILRRLRFAINLSDASMVSTFALGGFETDTNAVLGLMAREEEPNMIFCDNDILGAFLDGLIIDRRGPRDPSAPVPDPSELNNNQILKKLRIALNFREATMLGILAKGGHVMSKHELTAVFRKPSHKHFREAGGQLVRRFLYGLTAELRPGDV